MPPKQLKLPELISARLRQFERGRKWILLLRGLAECVLVFSLGILVLSWLEWVLKPQPVSRAWLSGANYFLLGAALLWRVALPLFRHRPRRQIAWDFEAAAQGKFQERIVSAVELSESPPTDQPGVSRWMMARTVALAEEEIGAVNPGLLVESAPAAKAWRWAGAGMLVLAAACLIPGFVLQAWLVLAPYSWTAQFSGLAFSVQPGNCRVKQGTPLEIKAIGLDLPDEVRAFFRWDDGYQESVPLSRSGSNAFTLKLSAIPQGFHYSVQAGEARSGTFAVKVDSPPRIARVQVSIDPPAYTHWTNRIVEGGSAEFLAGSHIRLLVQPSDEKVANAEWVPESLAPRRLVEQRDRLVLDLQPTNAISYQIRLTGANHLQSEPSQKWLLQPVPDQPPSARLISVGAEPGMVERDEVLPLQAEADDDVGLKRVDLVVSDKDTQADTRSIYALRPELASREVRDTVNYNLAGLGLVAGDEVQFQLVATDLLGQTNRTEPLSFTIGNRDKFLEAHAAARLQEILSDMALQADFLQQTRASWLAIARNYREDDPASQLPAVAVLNSRLTEFGREMQNIGRRLVNDSETNGLPEARFMYRLGSTIAAWGPQQEEVLLGSGSWLQQSKGTNVFAAFNLGGDLFNRALINLDQYKQIVAVLEGVFETDVLATRCDSAQGRYKRGLPILRSEKALAPMTQTTSGLLATFFEGVDLTGKILEQKIDVPDFDNYAPANRHEQWSCRYEGDLQIAQDGNWMLSCVSDDGVRLFIDGKSVLPTNSWAAHPAIPFRADLKLTAGWHPLIIEYFQGYSECKLEFLAARKGQDLRDVPSWKLRPPADRKPAPVVNTNAVLSAVAKAALKDRVRNSLRTSTLVPSTLIPITTEIQDENLTRLLARITPVGQTLATNLAAFASWKIDDSQRAEADADDLTAAASAAGQMLRAKLDNYRWRYDGAAALKDMEHALHELHDINQELRQQRRKNNHSEQAQSKIQLARVWNKELQRATAEASHRFFDLAKQKDATLAERVAALNASTKADQDLQPSVERLSATLDEDHGSDEFADHVEHRLNQITDHYRALNDLQEKINREQIATEARQALPSARAFVRSQDSQNEPAIAAKFQNLKQNVDHVLTAQRVAGDYTEAQKLSDLAGDSPRKSSGNETARLLWELAARTDRNVPSLAQAIPPPMRHQVTALEQQKTTAPQAANQLATPRLAMTLESSRLILQSDRKTAIAYSLLGEDLGSLLDQPDKLNAPALKPLADRAAALAGEEGEEARQAEIRAANLRFNQLAADQSENPEVLADRLDEMSALARQAADQAAKRPSLQSQLDQTSELAPPIPDWSESTDAPEIAASAAHESAADIHESPNQWEPYNATSHTLADAARQIRMNAAVNELGDLTPYPEPPTLAQTQNPSLAAFADRYGRIGAWDATVIDAAAPKGVDQAEWARLTARLREGIRSSGIENFSPEHQAAIRAYFERLSADSQSLNQK